jgi:hypothetical protein
MDSSRNSLSIANKSAALVLAFCFVTRQAAADDSVSITVGVKEWVTDWTTWRIDNVFYNTGRIQITEPLNSATRPTSTPQVSLRYGDFIASASYLVTESYPLSGAIDALSASRNEVDVNAGYTVLPGVVLTLGYKQIDQNYGNGPFKWSGPTAGLSGSAPLGTTNWAVYGLYGFGLPKLKVPEAGKDARNNTTFDANYSLVEAGLAYVVGVHRHISALRFTVSYRAQILNTRGYELIGADGYTAPNERDFTQGPTFGISGTF